MICFDRVSNGSRDFCKIGRHLGQCKPRFACNGKHGILRTERTRALHKDRPSRPCMPIPFADQKRHHRLTECGGFVIVPYGGEPSAPPRMVG
jgi:hypothetical protein